MSRLQQARPWVTTLARLVLAGVFGYSGLHKILHPVDSIVAVRAYELVPASMVELVGYGQPFLELALAVLLLAGFATRITSAGTAVLLVVFVAAVASAWARGLNIDCGCFSSGGAVADGETHYLRVILRDVGLIVLAGWAVVFPPGRYSLDAFLGGDRPDVEGEGGAGVDTAAAETETEIVTGTERTR